MGDVMGDSTELDNQKSVPTPPAEKPPAKTDEGFTPEASSSLENFAIGGGNYSAF